MQAFVIRVLRPLLFDSLKAFVIMLLTDTHFGEVLTPTSDTRRFFVSRSRSFDNTEALDGSAKGASLLATSTETSASPSPRKLRSTSLRFHLQYRFSQGLIRFPSRDWTGLW